MAHHDTSSLFEDAPVIHSYSRQDAIKDGVLIKCPQDLSREAGFVIPVAFTTAAWADAVAWTDDDNHRKGTCQDQDGATVGRAVDGPPRGHHREQLRPRRLHRLPGPARRARPHPAPHPARGPHRARRPRRTRPDRDDPRGGPYPPSPSNTRGATRGNETPR